MNRELASSLFIYDPETGVVTSRVYRRGASKAGSVVGSVHMGKYLVVRVTGKLYMLHNIIWLIMTNAFPPDGFRVDHRDLNGLNNKWGNLRLATYVQNGQNSPKRKHSKQPYKGVYARSHKWKARITVDKKCIYLGCFDTAEAAYEAYKEASFKYHGEFGRLE